MPASKVLCLAVCVMSALCVSCKKTSNNPASSSYLNDLREDFYNEAMMTDHEIKVLAKDLSEKLGAMSRDDLSDCYFFLSWVGGQSKAESLSQIQTFGIFYAAYEMAETTAYLANLTPDQKSLYAETGELPALEGFNCEDGLKPVNGRLLVMEKLQCVGTEKVTQTKDAIDVEYYSLRDFCYDAAWHYIDQGDLAAFDLDFDPSGAVEDLERAKAK